MDRFAQQRLVAGWEQERFARAEVVVYGRDWLGAFTVAGLAALGIGRILWLGEPRVAAAPLADWLQADPLPFAGTTITERTLYGEYDRLIELEWHLAGHSPAALVCCCENPASQALCYTFARPRQVRCLVGTADEGGRLGLTPSPTGNAGPQSPVRALGVAALLVDLVRMALCPLTDDLLPPEGPLALAAPDGPPPEGTVVLVGVGGIGTWAAVTLAAMGFRLLLADFDVVTPGKAALQTLKQLFPTARLAAEVQQVTPSSLGALARLEPPPLALLSAVDRAAARLDLQHLGSKLRVPVVQGGTGLFSADCFVQVPSAGLLLDEQLHGALSANAQREAGEQARGLCGSSPSYVAPGMMAAALMTSRLLQLCRSRRLFPALCWRSGSVPVESRSASHVPPEEAIASANEGRDGAERPGRHGHTAPTDRWAKPAP